jgi:transcriptional regulator GlxA family with amidase domain
VRSPPRSACRHLEDSAEGIEQTARACGYRTTEAMRRAFVEALGVSPAEYRRRFRPISKEHHADRHRVV